MTPNDKPDAEKQKRMWGGRFAEDTDKLVEAFNALTLNNFNDGVMTFTRQ